MAPVIPNVSLNGVFDKFVNRTFLKEGGDKYTNDPADKGGPTKWGVTEARARLAGYKGDMRDLTRDQAYAIIKTFFWVQPRFDLVSNESVDLAAFMLDIGTNRGPSVPSKWMQRVLNVMNNGAWPDLLVDGVVGAGTLTALGDYLDARRNQNGEQVLIFAMRALATVEYIGIAEANPTQERFEFGWIAQRAFA